MVQGMICIWNLEMKFKNKLWSWKYAIYRDRQTKWIQYTLQPTLLGGDIRRAQLSCVLISWDILYEMRGMFWKAKIPWFICHVLPAVGRCIRKVWGKISGYFQPACNSNIICSSFSYQNCDMLHFLKSKYLTFKSIEICFSGLTLV